MNAKGMVTQELVKEQAQDLFFPFHYVSSILLENIRIKTEI